MQDKAEVAAAACKIVSGCFLGVGTFLSEHWLQLLSGFFLVLTYATQVYFQRRRDRREQRRDEQNQPNSGQS